MKALIIAHRILPKLLLRPTSEIRIVKPSATTAAVRAQALRLNRPKAATPKTGTEIRYRMPRITLNPPIATNDDEPAAPSPVSVKPAPAVRVPAAADNAP